MPRQKYVVNNSVGIKNKGFERDINDDECADNDKDHTLRRRTYNKNASLSQQGLTLKPQTRSLKQMKLEILMTKLGASDTLQ